MEASNRRPAWRLINPPNNKKSQTGHWPEKKMLIYDVRSRYVYDNKQNYDKLSDQKTDVYGKVTRFLQKIVHLEGQFVVNGGFIACFL